MCALTKTAEKPRKTGGWTRRLSFLVLFFVLCGCGESRWTGEDAQVTTLGIDKDGKVLEIVVEDFAESYYDLEDLRQQFVSEIEAYNAQAGSDQKPRIELGELRQEGAVVRSSTTYQSVSDYTDFTGETLFFGTRRQARLRGFEMSQKIRSAGGGEYLLSDKDDELHVIFSDGQDHIVTPYKIIACTEGVKIISDTEADFSGTQGRGAVLLAK